MKISYCAFYSKKKGCTFKVQPTNLRFFSAQSYTKIKVITAIVMIDFLDVNRFEIVKIPKP